jgi:hypothetical protein
MLTSTLSFAWSALISLIGAVEVGERALDDPTTSPSSKPEADRPAWTPPS